MAWALYQLTRTAHGCGLMSHFTLMLWGCLSGKRFLTNGKCTVTFNLKNLEVILPYKSTKNPKSHFWLSSTEKPLLTQRTLSFKSKSLHHLWQVPQEQNPRPRFQCLDMCQELQSYPKWLWSYGDSLRLFHYLYTKSKPLHLQPLLFSKVAERTPLLPGYAKALRQRKVLCCKIIKDHIR